MNDELERLRRELAQAQETIRARDQTITHLNSEIQDVRGLLEILQRQRPKLSPQNLAAAFQQALARLQQGLESGEGRVDYMVSNLEIDLKTAMTLDEQGNLNFELPKADDILPLEHLSRLNLSFKPVPKPGGPPAETAEVPGLIGLTKEKALAVLRAAGFKSGSISEQVSSTTPGMVIAQDPQRYARAPLGSAIDLVVSRPRVTKVPKLVGLSKGDALNTLQASRLQSGEITYESSSTAPDTVLRQSIQAGEIVPVDTSIDLVLARPELVKVPDVVGKLLPLARRTLAMLKFEIGKVSEEGSTRPRGTVLRQDPKAESTAPAGSQVDLVVSKSQQAVVPDVMGVKREQAEKVIKESGLKIGKVLRRRSKKPVDTVIGQKPDPGTEVKAGSPVNLTVSYFATRAAPGKRRTAQ